MQGSLLATAILLAATVALAGPAADCRRLCRGERRECSPALARCLADARTAARATRAACAGASDPAACRREARTARGVARGACRGDHRRCRTLALVDCRRALSESAVRGQELVSCPVTPRAACTELGPDDRCDDPLHPADAFFWDRFRAGDYAAIPEVLARLEAGLAEAPGDPSLERHVAWSHVWRVGELPRGTAAPADVAQSLTQLRPRFARAVELNPGEPRVLGFLAAVTFVEGSLLGNADLLAQGERLLADAVAAWPEFNYFTAATVRARLPHDSAGFQLGLDAMWRNVDICAGAAVDRVRPNLDVVLTRETRVGRLRVCFDSWIAPFNVHGFLLHLGDMLVKDGQVATGVHVYETARRVPRYDRWPYRDVLEDRIEQAAANAVGFNQPSGPPTMAESAFACMGCHQAR